jgi:hypothetical protein
MRSFSKERQDVFAYYLFKNSKKPKIFLDVGCYHPFDGNNTIALEQNGWTGSLFDIKHKWVTMCRDHRGSDVYLIDSSTPEFIEIITKKYQNKNIDYISLDVDEGTLETLENIVKNNIRFKSMTLEHDAYKGDMAIRDQSRILLKENGYFLLFKNVQTDLTDLDGWQPWEDWWVDLKYFDASISKLAASDLSYKQASYLIMENSLENEICV